MTDLPASPESIQGMIKCSGLSDCAKARCASRKHDLECSPACDQCRGMSCTNSPNQFDDDSSQDSKRVPSNERTKTHQIILVNCETALRQSIMFLKNISCSSIRLI